MMSVYQLTTPLDLRLAWESFEFGPPKWGHQHWMMAPVIVQMVVSPTRICPGTRQHKSSVPHLHPQEGVPPPPTGLRMREDARALAGGSVTVPERHHHQWIPPKRGHCHLSRRGCIPDEKTPGHEATLSPPSRTCDRLINQESGAAQDRGHQFDDEVRNWWLKTYSSRLKGNTEPSSLIYVATVYPSLNPTTYFKDIYDN
ncbi:hypothetical protein EVAR_4187_1 [Eumeta japonica]|uniref:Uncharacterized protein n=1 Tax=Eumeta variegata TaxID=151549 RepID=A0A4C1TIL7_EUMVA|nr:hypothetical protein EVAR_4187_1 [Eumeta japonica]